MSEAQFMASKVDDDDDLEERMFTDDTAKRLENLLTLAWKLFVCLAFVFILSYWAIAIVHSYSSSHFLRASPLTSEYLELSGKEKLPFCIARVLSPNGRLKKQSL